MSLPDVTWRCQDGDEERARTASLPRKTADLYSQMNATQYPEMYPAQLEHELESTWAGSEFSRRTVVVQDEVTKTWVLFGCVLRPQTEDACARAEAFKFERVMLIADSLPASQVGEFLRNMQDRLSNLTGEPLQAEMWQQCSRQPVTLQNYWMKRPGAVYTWGSKGQPNPSPLQLLSLSGPYYPDVNEAAMDWLQLGGHAGRSDGFKGQLMLLLPETRAFLKRSSWSEDDEHLRLELAGTAVASGRVLVKGAYWCDKEITQIHEPADGGSVTLKIAREADRLHLSLMGHDGTVYEQHQEDLKHIGEKRFLGSRHRMSMDRIAKALKQGEGAQIEFKPFIALPKHKAGLSGENRAKLDEVLETVAAFSNAEGGTIFLGVTNDVRAVGISEGLARWAGAQVTREVVERYAGDLRSHLRDEMYLPVDLSVSVFEHQNEFLVLVEVPPSRNTLVSVKNDGRLLRRHGASNRRVPPEEWTPREHDMFRL